MAEPDPITAGGPPAPNLTLGPAPKKKQDVYDTLNTAPNLTLAPAKEPEKDAPAPKPVRRTTPIKKESNK